MLVAFPQTTPVGLSNDVMFASKNSSFFKKAIETLPSKNVWFGTHYLTVLFSTGSMFLSLLYFNQNSLERNEIVIIPPQLYSKKGKGYFRHMHGSSWHGTDALLIQWIVRNWYAIVLFFIVMFVCKRMTRLRRTRTRTRTNQSKLN